MDRLPDETISEVLVHARDGAGDTIEAKFSFPTIACLVSRRFHTVALSTHRLWTYVILDGPPSEGLIKWVGRSGTLPLVLKVTIVDGKDLYPQFLLPILPRLSSISIDRQDQVSFHLYQTQDYMPKLKKEDVSNPDYDLLRMHLDPALFPKLRVFRSNYGWWLDDIWRLPETVESVCLDGAIIHDTPGFVSLLCTFLPKNLQSLHLIMDSTPFSSDRDLKSQATLCLPNLVELTVENIENEDVFAFLDLMDAPALDRMSFEFAEEFDDEKSYEWAEEEEEEEPQEWSLGFSTLKHLQITTCGRHPRLATLLQDCTSITDLVIQTDIEHKTIEGFVGQLEVEPRLLPRLERFQVFGGSVHSLRWIVRDRPTLKFLKVHALDLGLPVSSSKSEFKRWKEEVEWIESSVALSVGNVSGYRFCRSRSNRYRTWEDVKKNNYIKCEETE